MHPPAIRLAAFAFVTALAGHAHAAEITSFYTELDADKTCSIYATAKQGEGDWASMVCDGHRGYPVFIDYDDARKSLFYGFPPQNPDERGWESFEGFNAAGPKIEWRVETDGEKSVPFATIHRWSVSRPDDPEAKTEVLVVEKIGQPEAREGCAVGYVVATGNPKANESARRIADTQARDFACGADQPAVIADSVPLPPFSRDGT